MNKALFARAVAGAALITLAAGAANAQNLISNGGFETGDFTAWASNVQSGSSGNLYVNGNGANSPQSGFVVPGNPGGGNFVALTDQSGPGSYSLTQAFTLASAGTVHISFNLLTDNNAGVAYPAGRDLNTFPNQNAQVDILNGDADPFTNGAGIVSILYGPGSDNNGWETITQTLNLSAGTYLFRFAETDNQGFFQAGLDNVSVTGSGAVPEPASWAMMLGGFGLVGGAMRRRSAAVRFA